jgi:hypothetical protein
LVGRKGWWTSELGVCAPAVMLSVQALNEACSDAKVHADQIFQSVRSDVQDEAEQYRTVSAGEGPDHSIGAVGTSLM